MPDNSNPIDDSMLTEQNYQPLVQEPVVHPNPNAPLPIYPAFTGAFATGDAARQFRQRSRIDPKKAQDLERVKNHGREFSEPPSPSPTIQPRPTKLTHALFPHV